MDPALLRAAPRQQQLPDIRRREPRRFDGLVTGTSNGVGNGYDYATVAYDAGP